MKNFISATGMEFWFLIIFFVSVLLSTIFSISPAESFYGIGGRRVGTILLLLCISMYLILGKYLCPGIWIVWIFLISNTFVILLAILNFWGIDPLRMYDNLVESDWGYFMSTLGNINVSSNYLCMVVPIGMVLYLLSDYSLSKIIYGIFLLFGFYGVYITTCDSWLLGIGISFVVILWFCMKDHRHMIRFFELCLLFFCSSLLLKITFLAGGYGTALGMEFQKLKLQNFMLKGSVLIIEGILFVLCIIWFKYAEKKKLKIAYLKARKILFIILAVMAGTLVILFLIANVSENRQWEGAFQWMAYLKLQDESGSYRGILWKQTINAWKKLPLGRKFLGYGVNCFHHFIYQYQAAELEHIPMYFVDAHNECLHFLSIMGVPGIIGYFGLLISLAVTSGKMSRKYPVMLIGTVSICSYLAQGMLNNPTVFITPNLFCC